MKNLFLFVMTAVLFVVPALAETSGQTSFVVTSSASVGKPETGFDSGLVSVGRLNPIYLGSNSPPFAWSGLPQGTVALAVVLDDPDARPILPLFGMSGTTYYHWTMADIDPTLGALKANDSMKLNFPKGTRYEGPDPPADVPADAKRPIVHIYRLRLYALSARTGLTSGFSPEELFKAMEGKTLGVAQLNFSYSVP